MSGSSTSATPWDWGGIVSAVIFYASVGREQAHRIAHALYWSLARIAPLCNAHPRRDSLYSPHQ
jgi:hypothetical protein